MTKFSDRIKELRKSMGWSQDVLADKLGTTRSCIGNYEQGTRKPDAEGMEQIADLFNVDLLYLMGKQDVPRRSDAVFVFKNDENTIEEPLTMEQKKRLESYANYFAQSIEERNILITYRTSDDLTKAMVRRTLGIE